MRHFNLSSSTALSDCRSYNRILIKDFRSASQKSEVGIEKDKSIDKTKYLIKNVNSPVLEAFCKLRKVHKVTRFRM